MSANFPLQFPASNPSDFASVSLGRVNGLDAGFCLGMTMKKCSVCKKYLDESNFTKRSRYKDGLEYECRICRNIKRKTNETRFIRRNYPSRQHRKKGEDRTKKDRDKRYAEKNKNKTNAQAMARRIYPVPQKCSIEGCDNIGQRHHPDYSKPKEIIWLCRYHHTLIHMKP